MRICVTIFSIGGKFRPVSNFTELHTLTQAAHSLICALGMHEKKTMIAVVYLLVVQNVIPICYHSVCLSCLFPSLVSAGPPTMMTTVATVADDNGMFCTLAVVH